MKIQPQYWSFSKTDKIKHFNHSENQFKEILWVTITCPPTRGSRRRVKVAKRSLYNLAQRKRYNLNSRDNYDPEITRWYSEAEAFHFFLFGIIWHPLPGEGYVPKEINYIEKQIIILKLKKYFQNIFKRGSWATDQEHSYTGITTGFEICYLIGEWPFNQVPLWDSSFFLYIMTTIILAKPTKYLLIVWSKAS